MSNDRPGNAKRAERRDIRKGVNRMPEDSTFYERIVPIMLGGLALVMLVLILVAAAVLLGLVRF